MVGLDHTTDPLELVGVSAGRGPGLGRAPGRPAFNYTVFSNARPAGVGGVPITDAQRYDALAGVYGGAPEDVADDYAVLVSCGPFRILEPGASISFRVALVAAANADTLPEIVGNAFQVHHGVWLNLLPDTTGFWTSEWTVGRTGLNGHESCVTAPPGEVLLPRRALLARAGNRRGPDRNTASSATTAACGPMPTATCAPASTATRRWCAGAIPA